MHGTQKIGKFWQRIPNVQQREFCKTCRTTETMEHILVHCQAAPRRIIWNLAEELWPHTRHPWPEISLGIILGCGTITLPPDNNENDPTGREDPTQRTQKRGAKRLLQILISEAAHLIWVLRCERVIRVNEDEDGEVRERIHTNEEVQTRWLKIINARLIEDKIIATRVKQDEKSLQRLKETWEPTLLRTADLPHNWAHTREVLVGRSGKTSENAASANTSDVASGVGKSRGHSTRVARRQRKSERLKACWHTGVETQDDNHIWVHIAPLIY